MTLLAGPPPISSPPQPIVSTPFSAAEMVALIKHLNWALSSEPPVAHMLPIPPKSTSALFEATRSGILLSSFVRYVEPTALDPRALNLAPQSGEIARDSALQNHTLCTNAATSIGCGVRNLQPAQLLDATSNQQAVLQLVWNLTKHELVGPLASKSRLQHHPELETLMRADEDSDAFARCGPEEILVRWVNYHLATFVASNPNQKTVPPSYRISNLSSDLVDSVALGLLLHQIGGSSAPFDIKSLRQRSLRRRAMEVVDCARRLGVSSFEVTPDDILTGSPRLLLAFVAAIFNLVQARLSPGSGSYARVRSEREDADADEREERALRMWMLSLGIEVADLKEDCRTGLPLLRAADAILTGLVNWHRVHTSPHSIYQRIENCAYLCEFAREQLRLKLVGIGGKDIADGSVKLTLALAWQLMRAHSTQYLEQLGLGEGHILEWANSQVMACGINMQLHCLTDPVLRSGVFLLHLLRSVAPECVSQDKILSGDDPDEWRQNAMYAISCAHKIGCTVFALWEDIVEVKAKMYLVLFAAAMAEYLRREEVAGREPSVVSCSSTTTSIRRMSSTIVSADI